MANWYTSEIAFNSPEEKDIILAYLVSVDITDALEHDDRIEVYIAESKLTSFNDIVEEKSLSASPLKVLEDKNWNALWESNFDPVFTSVYCVRADFHEADAGKKNVLIRPRMAFGTAHHPTSFMMIEALSDFDVSHAEVLDYGCGTGILAVIAIMEGAKHVNCIDIQEEAVENTLEHFEINDISPDSYNVFLGNLDVLPEAQYDLILANINRYVLSEKAGNLFNLLKEGGTLLLSGILDTDKNMILEIYKQNRFQLKSITQKADWLMMTFDK
jgi:ribosomal protein L11 methyltransferase